MEIDYYDANVSDVLSGLTSMVLSYVGAITLLILVITGIYYMMSQVDPAMQKRAKNAFSFALLGLIIIIVSYAVIGVIDQVIAN